MKDSNYSKYFINGVIVVVFSASAYLKLYTYYDFLIIISKLLGITIDSALIVANILVAIEIFVAFNFLFMQNTKTIILLTSIIVLFFTFIAVYFLFLGEENCYCFGSYFISSPFLTITKNIILLLLLWVLYKYYNVKRNDYLFEIFSLIVIIFAIQYIFNKPMNYFNDYNLVSVSVIQAKNNPDYLFVDARDKHHYNLHRIEGAINIPFVPGEFDISKYINLLNSEEYKDKTIVTYCDNNMCSLSKYLAFELRKIYSNRRIYYLDGGIEKW